MIQNKSLDKKNPEFWSQLDTLLAWESVSDHAVLDTVNSIIADIRNRGDEALIEYTNRFDRMAISSPLELEIDKHTLAESLDKISATQRQALESAASRIKSYADHQKIKSWSYTEADGTLLGQQVTALDKVGLYVPGGKAAYP
ncbi:MAG TPA: histidinol dehydrogenase, partial [Crenotrichaceae bacterium]|nr:histidinol dehydrogenase [Crenotrichaceae bacterium]